MGTSLDGHALPCVYLAGGAARKSLPSSAVGYSARDDCETLGMFRIPVLREEGAWRSKKSKHSLWEEFETDLVDSKRAIFSANPQTWSDNLDKSEVTAVRISLANWELSKMSRNPLSNCWVARGEPVKGGEEGVGSLFAAFDRPIAMGEVRLLPRKIGRPSNKVRELRVSATELSSLRLSIP